MAEQLRLKPYTPNQLRKCKCIRCGAPAEFQWSACADGNQWRPLCGPCDLALNDMVIKWMGFKDYASKMRRYARSIGLKWRGPTTSGEI